MTIIFIENVLGSGQVVTVAERFREQTLERKLRPGDNARILMSPFKSIVISESIIVANTNEYIELDLPRLNYRPFVLTKLGGRCNDD